jgi:cytochrome c-type biogenesis protein CcmH/NrfG
MPIHSVCPSCQTEYQLADHLGGQRVVCRTCQGEFEVPRPITDGIMVADEPPARADAVVRRPPRPEAPRRVDYDEDPVERLPRREAPVGLIVGAVVVVLLLLLGGAGAAFYYLRAAPAEEAAQQADQAAGKPPAAPPARPPGAVGGRRGPGVVAPMPDNIPDPQAQWQRGNVLTVQGRVDDAIAAYREAIRLKPDFLEAHTSLGLLLSQEEYHKEAAEACRKAVELKPDSAPAQLALGRVLLHQFRPKEAEAAFREALRIQPGDAMAMCQLGLALQNQGRLPEALEQLRQGDARGRQVPTWPPEAAEWVRQCERYAELAGKLPALLAGDAEPAGAGERADLVTLCAVQRHLNAAAARFAAQTAADDPLLTENQRYICFYNGACGAALAAGGQGEDARRLPDKAVVMLRRQALGWLRAELAGEAKQAEQNDPRATGEVRRQMRHWQWDPDLTAVRDPQALDRLPPDEQKEWRQLWADVDALLKKVAPPR